MAKECWGSVRVENNTSMPVPQAPISPGYARLRDIYVFLNGTDISAHIAFQKGEVNWNFSGVALICLVEMSQGLPINEHI